MPYTWITYISTLLVSLEPFANKFQLLKPEMNINCSFFYEIKKNQNQYIKNISLLCKLSLFQHIIDLKFLYFFVSFEIFSWRGFSQFPKITKVNLFWFMHGALQLCTTPVAESVKVKFVGQFSN